MISLVIVNYRTSALAVDAIDSARRASQRPLHVVVVDNSEDPAEAGHLRPWADVLLVSPKNRGYGGAINDARRYCQTDVIVVANPDVRFGPSSIDRLAEVLDRKYAASGPALFWDAAHRWHLPPAELHTGRSRVLKALSTRTPRLRARLDRDSIRRRIRYWSEVDPVAVPAISGAVMALRADALDAVEGFDERFHLYFEETDLLRRMSETGRRILHVPAARCHHMYNQSAGQDPERSGALFAESEKRYFEKWSGPLLPEVVARLTTRIEPADFAELPQPLPVDAGTTLVEASPLATFETAAGHFPDGPAVELPGDVLAAFRGGAIYLRAIDRASARVLGSYVRYRS